MRPKYTNVAGQCNYLCASYPNLLSVEKEKEREKDIDVAKK